MSGQRDGVSPAEVLRRALTASELDVQFVCYACARGEHEEHEVVAWKPDIPCTCSHPECVEGGLA